MYAANETGAVWSVDTLFEAGPGELLFGKEPSAEQLAKAFPGYRAKYAQRLCADIDAAADAARQSVVGDPLRAAEYERTATEAATFRDAGFPDDAVPRAVAAWAIGDRSSKEAAEDILREADRFHEALYAIRAQRLAAKEEVRQLVDQERIDNAHAVAHSTVKHFGLTFTAAVNL